MKCIHSATGKQLLDEIHAGQCGYIRHQGLWSGRLLDPISTGQLQRAMLPS
jgi:hypothetical protein